MEKILKEYEIDIVVSLVGGENLLDQLTLVEAMKAVKTIKVKLFFVFFVYFGSWSNLKNKDETLRGKILV